MSSKEPESNSEVILLTGDLDMAAVDVFRDRIRGAFSPGDLIIDLGGVGFMDSSGLSALLVAHVDCEKSGTRLFLRNVPPRLQRLLELAGLNDVLNIIIGDVEAQPG